MIAFGIVMVLELDTRRQGSKALSLAG